MKKIKELMPVKKPGKEQSKVKPIKASPEPSQERKSKIIYYYPQKQKEAYDRHLLRCKEKGFKKIQSPYISPEKHKDFLSEMALSYLISIQEAFIKAYIFEILVHKKELLRSSATITFEEVSNYTSIKALIASLALKEVDGIGHGSIDDVGE